MNLKECYDAFGGSYEEVEKRIPYEGLIQRMALKFPDDKTYQNLCKALEAGNCEEAFREAHTLKGVSRNLGFERLGNSSSELTEFLRGKEVLLQKDGELEKLLNQVKTDYELIIEVLEQLER